MSVVVAGTTLNTVTVTGTVFDVGSGAYATGTVQFSMTDMLWAVPARLCGITGQVGATLNALGQFSVSLLSHDNNAISTEWFWQFTGTIAGIVIPPRRFQVYYSFGATQDISQLLAASNLR